MGVTAGCSEPSGGGVASATGALATPPPAPAGHPTPGPGFLSPREREVLDLVSSGCTYRQVARRMGITRHTVDTYLRRVRAKTGTATIAELTRLAVRLESRGR